MAEFLASEAKPLQVAVHVYEYLRPNQKTVKIEQVNASAQRHSCAPACVSTKVGKPTFAAVHRGNLDYSRLVVEID
jgi:hypothetical protein